MSLTPERNLFFNDEDPGQLANQQSAAARSRARQMRSLERRAETLRDDANAILSLLALLKSNSGLTAESPELISHLHAMEQRNRVNDALNEEITEDIEQLKVATRQNLDELLSNLKPEQPEAAATAAASGPEDSASGSVAQQT